MKVVIEVEKGDEAQTYVEIKDDDNDRCRSADYGGVHWSKEFRRCGKKLEIEDQELLRILQTNI